MFKPLTDKVLIIRPLYLIYNAA